MHADRHCARLAHWGLGVRTYTVTPLGERVGLVQWVGDTVSVFSLFKQWQVAVRERHEAMVQARQEAMQASAGASGVGASGGGGGGAAGGAEGGSGASGGSGGTAAAAGLPPLPPMATAVRPMDLFYGRLLPALRAEGIAGMVPRRQWPVAALRKVGALGKRRLWEGGGGKWAPTATMTATSTGVQLIPPTLLPRLRVHSASVTARVTACVTAPPAFAPL